MASPTESVVPDAGSDITAERVAAAQAGCPVAMDGLLAELRPGLVTFCRARLASYAGGVEAAEDVVQEVCEAVYRVLPRYRDRGRPFQAWVYAIATNKVADAQRRFARSCLSFDGLPETEEPSPTPEDAAVSSAGLLALLELLGRLPERSRRVVLLRAAGLSAQAISERTGLSPAAVRVVQHRAVRRVRELSTRAERGEPDATPLVAVRRRGGVKPAA